MWTALYKSMTWGKEEITAIYHGNKGRYGYRRITLELRNRGYKINHKTVARLMRIMELKSIQRRLKGI